MDARPPERPPVTQAINTIGAHSVSFQAVSLKLRYETFLMQVLGVILWDMHTCPPEFLRAFDQERHLLNVDFVACGLMN